MRRNPKSDLHVCTLKLVLFNVIEDLSDISGWTFITNFEVIRMFAISFFFRALYILKSSFENNYRKLTGKIVFLLSFFSCVLS